MKEIKLNISQLYVRAEHLAHLSCYNNNYYRIDSCGDSCIVHNPFNIIRETCYEEDDYFEYTLGFFENEDFIGVFSWTTDYGEDSLFEEL